MLRTAQDVFKEAAQAQLAGNWPLAEQLYCQLLAHDDDCWQLHSALGTLYAQAGAWGRSMAFLRGAVTRFPDDASTWANLGAVYGQAEQRIKAIPCYEKALALDRNARTLSNLAGCFVNQGAPEKALVYADEALSLNPELPEAGNHRALALLELGRFEEGWAQYDSRLWLGHDTGSQYVGSRKFHRRPYTVPMWSGEAVKLLAIHGEQGLGDEVLFLTCLKQLREKYDIDRIVIECASRLTGLLKHSLGVACYGTHEELIAAEKPDAYLPMGSLPRFIWPVVPNTYLKPSTSYPRSTRRRIGFSWYGGGSMTHASLRNAPLETWKTILPMEAECVSLQYGDVEEQANFLGFSHDAKAIADLDRLAAMIRSCDLVISVCNTTIHMAGALGVPCLVLVPSKPAWRYGLTEDKMIWYESVKMLRQRKEEPWLCVLQRAKIIAKEMLGAHHPKLSRAEQAPA